MDLIPVEPPSYRRRIIKKSWLAEWGPMIAFFICLDVGFGIWYWKTYNTISKPAASAKAQGSKPLSVAHVRHAANAAGVDARLSDLDRLEAGQECLSDRAGGIGAVIVRSTENGTPTVRNVLENGWPVKCIGDHRIY